MAEKSSVGSAIGSVAGGLFGLIGTGIALNQQRKQFEQQIDLENSQLQRMVVDAEKAGISPLSALGATEYGAPVSQSPAITMAGGSQVQSAIMQMAQFKHDAEMLERAKANEFEKIDKEFENCKTLEETKNLLDMKLQQAGFNQDYRMEVLKQTFEGEQNALDRASAIAQGLPYLMGTDEGQKLSVKSVSNAIGSSPTAFELVREVTAMKEFCKKYDFKTRLGFVMQYLKSGQIPQEINDFNKSMYMQGLSVSSSTSNKTRMRGTSGSF